MFFTCVALLMAAIVVLLLAVILFAVAMETASEIPHSLLKARRSWRQFLVDWRRKEDD